MAPSPIRYPGYAPRISPRSHPVTHVLGAVRDHNGTPLPASPNRAGDPDLAGRIYGAQRAGRSRSGAQLSRAARAQRVERRRQRRAARTGRR